MDICGIFRNPLYYCVSLILELIFLLSVLDLSQGDPSKQLSQMRLYNPSISNSSPKPNIHKPIVNREREKILSYSKDASLALEYIDSVIRQPNRYCNKSALTLDSFNLKFAKSSFSYIYRSHAEKIVFIANTLTQLFHKDKSLKVANLMNSYRDILYELLKSTISYNTQIAGSGVAYDNEFHYIKKSTSGSVTEFKNFSSKYDFADAEFFSIPANRNYSHLWNQKEKIIRPIGIKDGNWTNPYFDCNNLELWITTYSVPFLHESPGKLTFSGVVMIDIDLNKSDINQCSQDNNLFSGSHKCQAETTKCEHMAGGGLSYGNYVCNCSKGFYFPGKNGSQMFFPGIELERVFLQHWHNSTNFTGSNFQCLPCLKGCDECSDDKPCMAEYNVLLRGIPLGIQSFCITVTIVIGVAVFRLRKCKVMVASMWTLLEVVLFGAILLYATIIIQYFEPSTEICVVIPWFREMGFAVVYGALILKVYRLLAEFQSRKAHRVHVRDKDLLKYLCCVIIVVLGYMSAWTTVTYDNLKEGNTLLQFGETKDKLKYVVCQSGMWEYVVEVAEFLFLCFGIYLCYRVRSAPSDFSEGTYVSAAICYEAVISIVFCVLRHVYWTDLHPDYLFLMSFIRCQLTVTVTLLLVFGPKLLYAHRPPDDHHSRNRAPSTSEGQNMSPESMKLNPSLNSNGDVDVGEISLADMDPEDIRAELKRLYTQLQVYKTRIMRKDNPHISKRRGGSKQTHRRFSIQPFHLKKSHAPSSKHDHEISKTPEESTNSAEMSIFEAMNKADDIHDKDDKKDHCTVTFKMR